MQRSHITVVLGTAREGRYSEKVRDTILDLLRARDEFEIEVVDVRDYGFVRTEPGWEESEKALPWREVVQRSDGFVFIVPEYNRGFPGEFKLLLDSASPRHYAKRAAMVVGVSSGDFGGARVITLIQPILSYLGLVHTNKPLHVQNVQELFTGSGEMVPERREQFERFASESIDALEWFSRILRKARAEDSEPAK